MDSMKPNGRRERVSPTARFPNAGYQTIAIVCIILIVVEGIGLLRGDGIKMALLFGIAILALLAPRIQNFTVGKEGIVADLAAKIDDGKNATVELDEQLTQQLTQLFRILEQLDTKTERSDATSPTTKAESVAAEFDLPQVTVEDDPQKGRFGGKEESNGRRLSAVVEQSSVKSDWAKATLKVLSLPGYPPLSGNVKFFVHDTFLPDRYIVQTANGEAELALRSWGAFTVGVLADNGSTRLELDLATSPNVKAPSRWRNQ